MHHFIIFISIFLCVQLAVGQNNSENRLQDIGYIVKQNNIRDGNKTFTEEKIAGSPYLNQQFIKSVIVKTDHSVIKDISLRFNIFSNRMEFKEKETVLYIANPYTIDRIIIENQIFVYAQYISSRNTKASYFQLLTDGNYQLLKMYKVTFKSPENKAEILESATFESQQSTFYFRYRNGMAHRISSQKELIKILQPVQNEVIDYIRKKRINTKNELQLIDLMNHTEIIMK